VAETVETRFLLTAQNRASAAIGAVRDDIDRASRSVVAFRGALATLGVGASAAIFSAQAKGAIDLADQLDDLAQRTGIAVDSLSVLRFAAQFAGVSFDELQTSLRFYNSRVADAAGGNKEALSSFERLGLSQQDVQAGLSDSEGLLRKVFDQFEKYAEGAGRSALASDIFGSRNEKMAQLLAIGSRGLADQRKELEEYGALIGPEFAARAAEFNDNLDRLATLSGAAGIALAERLLPQLNKVVDAFIKAKREGEGLPGALQRAIQVGTVGTDQQISDRRLVGLTDDLLKQERIVAEARANAERPNQQARSLMQRRYQLEVVELKRLQAEIQTTLTFRKQLDGEAQAAAAGSARPPGVQPPSKPTAGAGGADQGQAFLETLRKRLTAIEQDEFAVLRLEAAQKKVAASAEPLIRQLQTETEFRKELAEARQRDEQAGLAEIERRRGLVLGVADYVQELDQETRLMRLSNEERLIQIQLLRLEAAGVERSSAAFAAASETITRSVNVNAAAKIFEETRTPVERFKTEFERLGELLQSGSLDWDTYGRAVDQARERLQSTQKATGDTKSAAEELGLTFASAAEDALVKWEGFGNFFKGLEQDLIRIGTRKLLTEPLTNALGGLFKGGGSGGGIVDGFLKFIGARAMGGAVGAGMPYLVGESGPELFVPGASGSVVPNNRLGRGAPSVVINQHFAQGTSRETVMQAALQAGRAVQTAMRRNG